MTKLSELGIKLRKSIEDGNPDELIKLKDIFVEQDFAEYSSSYLWCCKNPFYRTIDMLKTKDEYVVTRLLEALIELFGVHVCNSLSYTSYIVLPPLFYAASFGNINTIKTLIRLGCHVDFRFCGTRAFNYAINSDAKRVLAALGSSFYERSKVSSNGTDGSDGSDEWIIDIRYDVYFSRSLLERLCKVCTFINQTALVGGSR